MKENDLSTGPILRKLIVFALPMIAGNMLQQIYNLADTLIVGRCIGSAGLASVGSSYTLMTFLTSVIIGLCMGSGALFSKDYGAKDMEGLKKDITHSFVMICACTVCILFIIYPCMNPILHILQIPAELYVMTEEYVSIVFAGLLFVFLYNFFSFLLRSLGNSNVSLWFLAFSSVLNIVLDYVFIRYCGMGVAGAAYATVIAQAVSGIGIMVYAMKKAEILKGIVHAFDFDKDRMKEIIVNDVSVSVQQSVMNFGILMIQGLVNSFGTVIMAAFAAAVKIDTLAYMPAQEFGNATSLFISANYGAEKHDRIRQCMKTAMTVSILFCLFVSVFIFCSSNTLMSLFVQDDPSVILEGVKYLRIEGSMYFGIGILFLWYGYYRGVGKPSVSLVLTVISLGTRVLLSYALAPHTSLGVTAIWLSIPIGWILADIVGLLLYRKRKC